MAEVWRSLKVLNHVVSQDILILIRAASLVHNDQWIREWLASVHAKRRRHFHPLTIVERRRFGLDHVPWWVLLLRAT